MKQLAEIFFYSSILVALFGLVIAISYEVKWRRRKIKKFSISDEVNELL